MSRKVKKLMIATIRTAIESFGPDMLVVDASRVNAITMNRLRLHMAESKINLLTVKNAVAVRALAELGITCAGQVLVGPSAVVFGHDDIVTLSKFMAKCVLENKDLQIRGGIADGHPLNQSDVEALSKSPGRLELISQISGYCLSPGTSLASSIASSYQAVASQVQSVASRD